MKKLTFRRVLKALSNYITFFLMVGFLISCCMMLFVTTLADTMGLTLTNENVAAAAKITFVNVLLLSLLFTIVDEIRRKLTLERPVKRIVQAAEKIMQGDFSARIETKSEDAEQFGQIIACFNNMARELSGVETLRTDFVSNVSHELKTPLAVMRNYAALLQQENLDEHTRMEYAKAICDATGRLSNMMTNILKLNRLENQQIYPKALPYDLSEQLRRCIVQFENVWENAGIELEIELDDEITVTADEELLELVWNNLLSNAFKFTDAGGTVFVGLSATQEYAVVTVRDTGCGMSQEVGERIFEKFYQADTSRAAQGNGLGLALVKRVIDITGGEIAVSSAVGEGSTFTVKIRRQ